jgi:Ca-activated chloride channel family protein
VSDRVTNTDISVNDRVITQTAVSRLECSLKIAAEVFLKALTQDSLKGIRFGIALGKGGAIMAVPLTDDAEAVSSMLSALGSGAIVSNGTNLEKLIYAALSGFNENFMSFKRIVLFTDGEELEGQLAQALDAAAKKGIDVIIAGSGRVEGSFVPEGDSFIKDKNGAFVVSRLKEKELKEMSEKKGLLYIDANRPDAGSILYRELEINKGDELVWVDREEDNLLWVTFVILAIICYILSKAGEYKLKIFY